MSDHLQEPAQNGAVDIARAPAGDYGADSVGEHAGDRRWLVTGAAGMLGRDLCATLEAAGEQVTALTRTHLDITDPAACRAAVRGHTIVLNAAAWTDVDGAEPHEDAAFAVNATGAASLASASAEEGARLVHFSTDYVFSGEARTPYAEDAPLGPKSAYGRSKAAGEVAVRAHHPGAYVVRTAWLYARHSNNFLATMTRLAKDRDTVSVVTDQHGQPTWTVDVAAAVVRLVLSGAPIGTYHATNAGATTWHGFAQEAFRLIGLDPMRVLPTTTEAFPRPAPRPAYSVLGHDAWGEIGLPGLRPWQEALAEATASGRRRP